MHGKETIHANVGARVGQSLQLVVVGGGSGSCLVYVCLLGWDTKGRNGAGWDGMVSVVGLGRAICHKPRLKPLVLPMTTGTNATEFGRLCVSPKTDLVLGPKFHLHN